MFCAVSRETSAIELGREKGGGALDDVLCSDTTGLDVVKALVFWGVVSGRMTELKRELEGKVDAITIAVVVTDNGMLLTSSSSPEPRSSSSSLLAGLSSSVGARERADEMVTTEVDGRAVRTFGRPVVPGASSPELVADWIVLAPPPAKISAAMPVTSRTRGGI